MKKRQRYTEARHAQRLTQMLKRKEPCQCCPAVTKNAAGSGSGPAFSSQVSPFTCWSNMFPLDICNICRTFIGLEPLLSVSFSSFRCPCKVLGEEKALALTLEKLEEYYDNRR